MYTALQDNKLIPDPLYRDNDVKLAWIGHENWTYTRYFQLSSDLVQSSSVQLVAEGLDTVSTVFINDHQVAHTSSMFHSYTWQVKPLVQPGNNSITIRFQSATDYATKQAGSYPYPVPPNCPVPVQHGECHVNFIRKEQCSFSWDWGPSFLTQGIWKPIYIQAFDSAVLDTVTVEVVADGDGWQLRTRSFFSITGGRGGSVRGLLAISLDGTSVTTVQRVTLTSSSSLVPVNVSVPESVSVKRWWPNGYGTQTLYRVYVTFTSEGGEVSSSVKRVGFRTVELVQDPVSADPKQGLTFYFRVNGLPVFFKGSNWIPTDSFQERITKGRIRTLLQSAVDAHMNSMRVWGGGVYESEDLYDLADELGILIWQDLMFSVAMYPTDPAFLDSVAQEVRYQVRRLMHRPSILLWAGSNENEKALRENWFDTNKNYTLYYHDYIKLYVTTIMPIVRGENPDRVYLTSSPSDGKETVKEGYVAKDPASELYGDTCFFYENLHLRPNLCVPTSVSQPLCPNLCVPSSVCRPLCADLCVPTSVSRPLCPDLCVPTSVSRPLCPNLCLCILTSVSRPLCPNLCVPTSVSQPLSLHPDLCVPTSVSRPLCPNHGSLPFFKSASLVSATVALLCPDLCVPTSVSQPLCADLCVPTSVSASRPLCPDLCVPTSVSQPLCPNLCLCIPTSVCRPLCPDLCVPTSVSASRPLCADLCVPTSVSRPLVCVPTSVSQPRCPDLCVPNLCVLTSVSRPLCPQPLCANLCRPVHFYDYLMDQWASLGFRVPRFASEYGVEAWCSYPSLQSVLLPADLAEGSAMARHRQHHAGGKVEMEAEILRHLSLPSSETPEPLRFQNMIYLTQINQAMSIKSQTEHYRRHQSALLADGRGLTMGALYWQLNDIWQAPTWASIDYSLRWKMLHYYALHFFSPVIVSPCLQGDVLDVYIIVDEIPTREVRDPHSRQLRMEPMTQFTDILQSRVAREDVLDLTRKVVGGVNGVLTVAMYSWANFKALRQWTVPYKLNTTAESVMQQNVSTMMREAGCLSRKDCFIHVYANDPSTSNWLYLAQLKDSHLQNADVSISDLRQDSAREFTVTVATNAIALFVWLESADVMGRFSDNGFLLLEPKTTLTFHAWQDVTYTALRAALTVSCLTDVYRA
ncbi:hypothetical protein ACOMHN_023648 [Nucella lapillus]